MNIGKYTLESDSMNIILKKPNKEMYYFSSVANALKFLVDEEVRESQLTDIKTVVSKQQELYKLIESLPPITVESRRKKRRENL